MYPIRLSMNTFIFAFTIILFGCLNNKDNIELRGIGGSGGIEFPTETEAPRAIVDSIAIIDNKLIINGDNLHLIDRVSLNGDQEVTESEGVTSIKTILSSLKIFSQDKSKIIITSSLNEKLSIYFGSRYDLILDDLTHSTREIFPFYVNRNDLDLQTNKLVDFSTFDPKVLDDNAEHEDVLSFNSTDQKWELGRVTGQFKYLGNYDPISNLGYHRFDRVMHLLTDTGMNSAVGGQSILIENGHYLVISKDCNTNSNCSSILSAIFPSLSKFNAGDWLIFDGTTWKYINNKGQVTSFNDRIGSIQGCPNLLCPLTYDYNWSMLKRDNTGNLLARDQAGNETPALIELIEDFPSAPTTATSEDLMIKFRDGRIVIEEDELGITIAESQHFKNAPDTDQEGNNTGDTRLKDVNFANNLDISKFDGLEDAADEFIDANPLAPVTLQGDLTISQSASNNNPLGVSSIQIGASEFSLPGKLTSLSNLPPSGKQQKFNLLGILGGLDQSKQYFLSNNGSDLVYKEINSSFFQNYVDSDPLNSKLFFYLGGSWFKNWFRLTPTNISSNYFGRGFNKNNNAKKLRQTLQIQAIR